MIISCQSISFSYGDEEILKNVNFNINDGEKVALVGINGAGKTTLLSVILGKLHPDKGSCVISKDVSIGYLAQNQESESKDTVYKEMKKAKQYILDMKEEMSRLEKDMSVLTGAELESALKRYNVLQTKFDRDNGYAYESEITGTLTGLGFSEEDYDRKIDSLSGGQKMRIALGHILLTRPDIIILDEPTNHLDINSVRWLEGYLSSYPGAVLCVSHDRYFIDRICGKIVELDQGISTVFNGDYSFYARERQKLREDRLKAYLNQQKVIKHEEEVIRKLKSFNREKSIKRAESREKMLDKMEVLDKPTEVNTDMKLIFTPSSESGEDVLYAEGLKKAYGDNLLFEELGLDIKKGEHVALIGGNGTGKTTILRILGGMTPKDKGMVRLGAGVRIGYFDQEHKNLNPENTIFDEISDAFPELTNTRIRNLLAAFLFTGDQVFKKIGDLSGGEEGRVSLAKLMLSPANFLILDEPTNHLDIQSKEILESAVRHYTGTVLYVSHDRYFINRTATRILELRNRVLTNYIGDYDFFDGHRDEYFKVQHGYDPTLEDEKNRSRTGFTKISNVDGNASGAGADSNALGVADGNASAGQPVKGSREEYLQNKARVAEERKKNNRIAKLEGEINTIEERLAEIDETINLPENGSNVSLLLELSKEKEELEEKLEELYESWDEISD